MLYPPEDPSEQPAEIEGLRMKFSGGGRLRARSELLLRCTDDGRIGQRADGQTDGPLMGMAERDLIKKDDGGGFYERASERRVRLNGGRFS